MSEYADGDYLLVLEKRGKVYYKDQLSFTSLMFISSCDMVAARTANVHVTIDHCHIESLSEI